MYGCTNPASADKTKHKGVCMYHIKANILKTRSKADLLIECYVGEFLVNTFLIVIKIAAAH